MIDATKPTPAVRKGLDTRQMGIVAAVHRGASTAVEVWVALGYCRWPTPRQYAEINELVAGGHIHACGPGRKRRLGVSKVQAEDRYWLALADGDAARAAQLRQLRALGYRGGRTAVLP